MAETETEERGDAYRLSCPHCGFEAAPFDYSHSEAEQLRQTHSGRACPGCDQPMSPPAIIHSSVAERSWQDLEQEEDLDG